MTGFCHIYYCSLAIRGERDFGVCLGGGVGGGGGVKVSGRRRQTSAMHAYNYKYVWLLETKGHFEPQSVVHHSISHFKSRVNSSSRPAIPLCVLVISSVHH